MWTAKYDKCWGMYFNHIKDEIFLSRLTIQIMKFYSACSIYLYKTLVIQPTFSKRRRFSIWLSELRTRLTCYLSHFLTDLTNTFYIRQCVLPVWDFRCIAMLWVAWKCRNCNVDIRRLKNMNLFFYIKIPDCLILICVIIYFSFKDTNII